MERKEGAGWKGEREQIKKEEGSRVEGREWGGKEEGSKEGEQRGGRNPGKRKGDLGEEKCEGVSVRRKEKGKD